MDQVRFEFSFIAKVLIDVRCAVFGALPIASLFSVTICTVTVFILRSCGPHSVRSQNALDVSCALMPLVLMKFCCI